MSKRCVTSFQPEQVESLEADMLLRLAHRFTNESDVRRLGSSLRIPRCTVESTLTNNRHDICSAAYVVLDYWEKGRRIQQWLSKL